MRGPGESGYSECGVRRKRADIVNAGSGESGDIVNAGSGESGYSECRVRFGWLAVFVIQIRYSTASVVTRRARSVLLAGSPGEKPWKKS
ncbi:unnamed protein product [Staurois parvus]|uniref:Uncharacterized protein n=1 Tax=Staurois parvus TaxID=386267 RepID=A0ABN9GGX9_9NEOB|nr:unnamed protein product [Staurois parvus]